MKRMNDEMIKEVARRADMTMEEAQKRYSEERKALRRIIGELMRTKDPDEKARLDEEMLRRAHNAAICKKVIELRKEEIKEHKKQTKADAKNQKMIEKVMKKNNKIRTKRAKLNNKLLANNSKIVGYANQMIVNVVAC